MRFGFSLMLIASLALHGVVGLGVALVHFYSGRTSPGASPGVESTTLMVLRSDASFGTQSVPVPVSIPRPVAVLAAPKAFLPTPASQAALALETKADINLRALSPEAILAPRSAPHLVGKNGVVFLLDVSGSMYEPYAGSTRLVLARAALADRIRLLKNGTPFAIVLYAERSQVSGPLIAADDVTREAAIRYIMRDVDCGGGTNLPDGVAGAEQLEPGTLVVVTDGDLNMDLPELTERIHDLPGFTNHRPALAILGISPRPKTTDGKLLQSLADEFGGIYRPTLVHDSAYLTASRLAPETP